MLTRIVWRWQLAAWRHQAGADARFILIAIAPVSLLLPLDHGGFFQSWLQGAVIVGWLYALFIAAAFAGDSGALETPALWLFQKGISLTDYSLARLLSASFAILIATGYATVWFAVAALAGRQLTLGAALTWSFTVVLVALISAAVLFLVSSFSVRRGTDFLLVLTILAMLRELLFSGLPAPVQSAVSLLLPPLHAALLLVQSSTSGDLENASTAAARVLSYIAVCVSLASVRHHRWRPHLRSSS